MTQEQRVPVWGMGGNMIREASREGLGWSHPLGPSTHHTSTRTGTETWYEIQKGKTSQNRFRITLYSVHVEV